MGWSRRVSGDTVMVDDINLTWNWKSGVLKQQLARLPNDFDAAAKEALEEAGDFMKMVAKALVLVDTGTLRKTIRKERGAENTLTVRAGGYFINPKTGKICDYATYVEIRSPFMQPAYDMTKPFLKQKIREKVLEQARQ